MVFAGAAEPVTLDPFFASDGESFRVARQIFEGLVGTEPGTADPAPLLAKEWTVSEDGLSLRVHPRGGRHLPRRHRLQRRGRLRELRPVVQRPRSRRSRPDLTYYYGALMRGFATGPTANDALYKSCTPGEGTATIELNEPFAGFVSALSLPCLLHAEPVAPWRSSRTTLRGTRP